MATAQGGGLPLPASPATRAFPPPVGGPLVPGFVSLQRQHCYLCDLPRTPWALLVSDYSEPVCRGCVNYEGPHRVEAAIESARRLKQTLGATTESVRPSSRLPPHLISLPVPVSARDEGLRGMAARAGDGVRLAGVGRTLSSTAVDLGVPGQRGPTTATLPRRPSDDTRPTIPTASTVATGLAPPPPPPRFPPSIPGFQLDAVGLGAASLPLALVRSGLGDLPAVINGKRPSDPTRALLSPSARSSDDVRATARPDVVSPMTAARSRVIVETLATLACSAPFDVRLKMDHSVVGRVLAFDAAKPGLPAAASPSTSDTEPLQLAMFVELPAGSGLVYGCCGEVSPVGWTASQIVDGDPTPFRHLEYRVKPDTEDWRALSDLLPDSVRCFREPLDRALLPTASRPSLSLVDAAKAGAAALGYGWNAAAAAAVALHLPPFMRPFQLPNPLLPGAGSRKRKTAPGGDGLDTDMVGSTISTSTLPTRLDLAADGLAIKRRLWMQSQADALRLALAFPAAAAAAAVGVTDGLEGAPDGGPRPPPRRSNSSSPPSARSRHHHQPQRMISSDETCINHLTRPPSAHSPGRSGTSPTRPASTNGGVTDVGLKAIGSPSPRCTLCRGRLEDTHFVQCPSVVEHKFCFPCSRDSIKQQLATAATVSTTGHPAPTEVYCPSGERCPLLLGVAGGVPWAFMASEIDTILGSSASELPSEHQQTSTATTTSTTSSSAKDLNIKKERDT